MRQAHVTPAVRAAFRAWPLDASIRHLILLDVAMEPESADVQRWVDEAFRPPAGTALRNDTVPHALRTGALSPRAAAPFLSNGFVVIDRLALLARSLDRVPPRSRRDHARTLRRLRRPDLDTAASIDQACFPPGWQNDRASLAGITAATPRSRARLAVLHRRRGTHDIAGFAITGRAGTTGYLQRLAVHPDARRNGIARLLVDDALVWLARRGATRALVNTGVDNTPALRLYGQADFERLDDELVVLECRRPA